MLPDSPQHSEHMHAQSIRHREWSWIQDTEPSFQLLKNFVLQYRKCKSCQLRDHWNFSSTSCSVDSQVQSTAWYSLCCSCHLSLVELMHSNSTSRGWYPHLHVQLQNKSTNQPTNQPTSIKNLDMLLNPETFCQIPVLPLVERHHPSGTNHQTNLH